MYAPCYYQWIQPFCISAFPDSYYPFSYTLPACCRLPTPEAEISSLSPENAVKIEEEQQPVLEQEEANSSCKPSRFKYPKKNVESNVINQVISYLTTKSKSQNVLRKILPSEEKVQAFYEILKQVKKKNPKYMGRTMLQSLLEADEDHPVSILHKKLKSRTTLKLSQIRRALIRMTCYFLKNIIVPTLLTSSKLDKGTLPQHLLRAREILCFVSCKPSPAI